ncbi:MAG: peptide transporter, partial [Atopobiaceae bacterium]|nr:peptide transporter [Atopobiaceae bacterium]
MAEKTQQVEQPALTLRAVIIGAVGSAVLTASSLFIALRMGMLPWPIAFAAIVSVLALRALGSKNLHEANVCHAAMSAGSMIAGGLA